jgi:hypothetical protein
MNLSLRSDSHKFVIILNAKCGSTSMFWWLREHTDLVPDQRAIVDGRFEALTKNPLRFVKKNINKQEEVKNLILNKDWGALRENEKFLTGFRGIWEGEYPCGWTSSDVDLDGYFKFLFVRNPWARLVSHFHGGWQHNPTLYRKDYTFKDYVSYITSPDLINSNRHWFVQSSNLPLGDMNFIGKLENFENDFSFVCQKIGVTEKPFLHINKSTKKYEDYTLYYDKETRKMVAERYAEDINNFGYKFGQ